MKPTPAQSHPPALAAHTLSITLPDYRTTFVSGLLFNGKTFVLGIERDSRGYPEAAISSGPIPFEALVEMANRCNDHARLLAEKGSALNSLKIVCGLLRRVAPLADKSTAKEIKEALRNL